MRTELIELLADMKNRETHPDSQQLNPPDQSIAWYAIRKAESWRNENDYDNLVTFIQDEKNSEDDITNAFKILISLIYNRNFSITPVFELLSNIQSERIIDRALYRIYDYKLELTNPNDINVLFQLAQSDHEMIRIYVWKILGRSLVRKEEIEDQLLVALKHFSMSEEAEAIITGLQRIGTRKSLPFLKELMIEHKNREFLTLVVRAITFIGGKEEIPFLIEQLNFQTNGILKTIIAKDIAILNDSRAIPPLIQRVKQVLQKKRTMNLNYPKGHLPELVQVLVFLKVNRATDDVEIGKLFDWIKNKKLDFLSPMELEWVEKNL